MVTEINFECEYCGYTWKTNFYYVPDTYNTQCEKCKDKNIKYKRTSKIDYYAKDLDNKEKEK